MIWKSKKKIKVEGFYELEITMKWESIRICFQKMQKKNSYIIPSYVYMSNSSFLIKQISLMHPRIHACVII